MKNVKINECVLYAGALSLFFVTAYDIVSGDWMMSSLIFVSIFILLYVINYELLEKERINNLIKNAKHNRIEFMRKQYMITEEEEYENGNDR